MSRNCLHEQKVKKIDQNREKMLEIDENIPELWTLLEIIENFTKML